MFSQRRTLLVVSDEVAVCHAHSIGDQLPALTSFTQRSDGVQVCHAYNNIVDQ